MKRKNDTPTRAEVTEKVENNKQDMTDKAEELDTIATDTETVRETLGNLDFDGTTEGVDAVQEDVEKAEDVSVEIFDEQDENLEEIQSDTEEYEDQLQERSDSSESDFDKVTEASDKISTEETRGELEQAGNEIRDDIEFLNDQEETAKEARTENEQIQQQNRARVPGGGR